MHDSAELDSRDKLFQICFLAKLVTVWFVAAAFQEVMDKSVYFQSVPPSHVLTYKSIPEQKCV